MKIEFFEETNFSYRRKQDLEKDLNLHWIARNMAGDKVGDIPAILQVLQHPLTTFVGHGCAFDTCHFLYLL